MGLNRREFIGAAAGTAFVPRAMQPTDDDPLGVRRDFPAVHDTLYLNSAYIAPVPESVANAGRAFAERKMSKPIPLDEMLRKTDEVRGQFARLVNAAPEEIGFLYATSEGENILAAALDLKAGDNVVVDELHYNTSFVLYRELEKSRRIELRIVKHRGGRVTRDDFERHVNDRTRLVSVAWVSHQNGFRHEMRPIADLAHAHGALFYTDAVQALGMFPTDVKAAGIDCLTSGTYKWLLGGFGVAPFFLRRDLLDRVQLDRYGALHVEKELDDHHYEIFKTAKKFEYATLAFGEVYQLGAALAYLDKVGVDNIERHTVMLAQDLWSRLNDLGFTMLTPSGNRSSILSIELSASQQPRAQAAINKAGAQVSFRAKGTHIRISPALFNNRDDVRRFVDVAKTLA
ncbi:MAG TPA: aminotransferase class V-fold PLP-dependent enzyme [Vicinamibacterales bacterium]